MITSTLILNGMRYTVSSAAQENELSCGKRLWGTTGSAGESETCAIKDRDHRMCRSKPLLRPLRRWIVPLTHIFEH